MESTKNSAKRRRTRFNSKQIKRMEQVFTKTHYPDSRVMEMMALQIDVPTHKMQIWFQNRRAKWRKTKRLRNFGNLESVKVTEYVPAPQVNNTINNIQPLYLPEFNFYYNVRQQYIEGTQFKQQNNLYVKELNENNVIDLSKASVSYSELSPELMPTVPEIYEKSNAYKKSGGLTSIDRNEHTNAFEYPAAHNHNKKEMPSFAFPSNQNMSSLLFASTLA